jgi:hypothetical protein
MVSLCHRLTLPHDFIYKQCGGNGRIQRIDAAEHGNLDKDVAGFLYET